MLEYLGVDLNGIGFLVGRRVIHTARVHELRKKEQKLNLKKKETKKYSYVTAASNSTRGARTKQCRAAKCVVLRRESDPRQ